MLAWPGLVLQGGQPCGEAEKSFHLLETRQKYFFCFGFEMDVLQRIFSNAPRVNILSVL